MSEPAVTEDITQSVRDAQDRFDAGMGADGDASPYPMLRQLRATGAVHPGWPEMGLFANAGDGPQTFSAVLIRHGEDCVHRQCDLQHAYLRGDRSAVGGPHHPRDG
jgi:hypothetical protein